MVEHDELAYEQDASSSHIPDRPGDLRGFHISTAIPIFPNSENAGMTTTALHDQIVKVLEIIVVCCDDNAVVANRMQEMDGIVHSNSTHICGCLHVVTGAFQYLDQMPPRAVVVEIDSHSYKMRAISCGLSSLGLGLYL